MKTMTSPDVPLFRVWIARYRGARPSAWYQVPRRAVAVRPAEPGYSSADEALAYLEGFNGAMLRSRRRCWAIAVPVEVRFQGEPRPGERIVPRPLVPTPRSL